MTYSDWAEELLYFFIDQWGGNTHNPYRDKYALDSLGAVLTIYRAYAERRATRKALVNVLNDLHVPSLLQCEILDQADTKCLSPISR